MAVEPGDYRASEPATPRWPLQFSLRTVLGITTSVAVALALIRWRPGLGGSLAILSLGAFWSQAAYRAGHRGLAFYLAAFAMGPVIVLVVGALPWLFWRAPGNMPDDRVLLLFTLDCSLAAVVCVRLLRASIRGNEPLAGVAAAAVYVTAEIVPLAPLLATLPAAGIYAITAIMASLFIAPLAATFYLPFAWPVAFVCVWILRRVCPVPSDADIVLAVSRLNGHGPLPLTAEHVARVLRCREESVKEWLDRLVSTGVLHWSAGAGYGVHPGCFAADGAAAEATPSTAVGVPLGGDQE